MRTSLLDDAGTVLRRMADMLPTVEAALAKAEAAPPGADHQRETKHVELLTRQLRSEAHGLASYVSAAASVR